MNKIIGYGLLAILYLGVASIPWIVTKKWWSSLIVIVGSSLLIEIVYLAVSLITK
jgi:hypothetical protein